MEVSRRHQTGDRCADLTCNESLLFLSVALFFQTFSTDDFSDGSVSATIRRVRLCQAFCFLAVMDVDECGPAARQSQKSTCSSSCIAVTTLTIYWHAPTGVAVVVVGGGVIFEIVSVTFLFIFFIGVSAAVNESHPGRYRCILNKHEKKG